MENSVQIDYAVGKKVLYMDVAIATYATAELANQVRSEHVHVFEFEVRRGKLAVLCDLARQTSADILVLTDANTMLERNCVRNMVRHFADANVGAVSGEEIRTVARGTDPGAESLYWRYYAAIKGLGGRLNCSLGGKGAALAGRRWLFQPEQYIVEDFQITL